MGFSNLRCHRLRNAFNCRCFRTNTVDEAPLSHFSFDRDLLIIFDRRAQDCRDRNGAAIVDDNERLRAVRCGAGLKHLAAGAGPVLLSAAP
jgi:hypothetical protein